MINARELFETTRREQTNCAGAAAGKVNFLTHEHLLPRKLGDSLRAKSATRNGIFFLLLLFVAAIVIHHCSKRSSRLSPPDEEAPREEDNVPALPGPHIDANTRMHLEDRPQTFYDWVRASNAASWASPDSNQRQR